MLRRTFRKRICLHLCFLGFFVAVAQVGCDSLKDSVEKSMSSPDPNEASANTEPAAPVNPEGKTLIEIVKCEAIAESISRYQLSATYRFTSGKPKPNLEYTLQVAFPGCPFRAIKPMSGRDLQMEGTIQWIYELPGIGERGESETTEAEFLFSEEFERQGNRVDFLGVSRPKAVKVDMSRLGL